MAVRRRNFNAPNKATGACTTWFPSCFGTGDFEACRKLCTDEAVTAKRVFRSQSGTTRVVPVRRASAKSKNANFMMASGRSTSMSNFLHEVGIIMVGVGAWYFIAAPLLKKVGIKPLSI
mgnify:FL=1